MFKAFFDLSTAAGAEAGVQFQETVGFKKVDGRFKQYSRVLI